MEALLPAIASAAVLLLPGLAVLPWLPRLAAWRPQDLWEFMADAVGLSIALSVLTGLLFFLLRFPPGGWGMALLGALALFFLIAAGLAGRLPALRKTDWLVWLAGGAALTGLVALRVYQVRGLAFPNWVDSVHHTLIVRAILEYGGVPANLQLTDAAPFHYHYGFHLLAAEMAALAQVPVDQAVLWFGHALFAASSLTLYRLGRSLGFDQRGAFIAALLPSFVLQMPGYYVSWGRYTLLTGLVLLPVAMAAALDLLDHRIPPRPEARAADFMPAVKLVLLTAGLCLTHYLALLLFIFFLAVIGVERLVRALHRRQITVLPWTTAGACILGAGLALPWLAPMLQVNIAVTSLGEARNAFSLQDFKGFVDMLRPDQSLAVMALAGCCLLAALFRAGLRPIAIWGLLMAFFAMPFAPKLGPFRADHFTIVLFLPAALLLGWGLSGGCTGLAALIERLRRGDSVSPGKPARLAAGGLLALAVGLLLVWGVVKTRNIVNNGTIIADAADRRALEWVVGNTPPDARFYINSTLWMSGVYRGVDGGYWLLPFAGRYSLVPPIAYTWQPEPVWRQINDWAKRSAEVKDCSPEFWQISREAGLTYVYAREGKGSLQPAALDQCPRLEALYRQEEVGIYRIKEP